MVCVWSGVGGAYDSVYIHTHINTYVHIHTHVAVTGRKRSGLIIRLVISLECFVEITPAASLYE